jgi:hypothetical protein
MPTMPTLAEAASMGVRVARTMHGRWRRMAAPERTRLQGLADDVRKRALDLRGSPEPGADRLALQGASERLAAAMVDSAQTDPEVSDIEVEELRSELARELGRLERSDVKASRADTTVDEPR